jgi:hypothetical protein
MVTVTGQLQFENYEGFYTNSILYNDILPQSFLLTLQLLVPQATSVFKIFYDSATCKCFQILDIFLH